MNIRNTLLASAAALALSTLATGAFAGTLSASAASSVTVISPTTLTKTQDMAFGTVVRPTGLTGNTTFKLNATDTVTATGGDGAVMGTTPTSSAKFNLSTVAAISYSASAVLSFAPAGNLINISATPATIASTPLAANGSTVLVFGGQFDVTPTTVPQLYTGTLAVTVTYN